MSGESSRSSNSSNQAGDVLAIAGAERALEYFGRWPSFHDAEVTEVRMVRDGSDVDAPLMEVTLHGWEATRDGSDGAPGACRYARVTLGFFGVREDVMK